MITLNEAHKYEDGKAFHYISGIEYQALKITITANNFLKYLKSSLL